MTGRGRPLRFLAAALGGWTLLRAGMLWPTIENSRDLVRALLPSAAAAALDRPVSAEPATVSHPQPPTGPVVRATTASPAVAPPTVAPSSSRLAAQVQVTPASPGIRDSVREAPLQETGAIPPPLRPTPVDPTQRLTGSAWGIVRDGVASGSPGGGLGGQLGGQLGGSQLGVRLAYALGASRRVALTARVSTPLAETGSEAAIGVEYRPPHLPMRIIAEQRVALDGGRGGQALYAVSGIAPTAVAVGFRLEGYAQGGVVLRGEAQGFADGAARLTRRMSRNFDIGAGAWGGVQPGVARVDVGPTIGISLPVARQRIRVSLDWRQRVAGRARPGSGPALSVGSDF